MSKTTIVQGHIFFNPVSRSLEFGENIMFKKTYTEDTK